MNDEKTIHIAPPKRIEKAGIFVLIMLGLFLLFEAIGAARGVSTPIPPVNTISVTGVGQAALAPDIAHLTFTVEQTATTVSAAQAAATKQANAAIAYVAAQGISSADITTLAYNISPQYANVNPPCEGGVMCPIYNGGQGTPTITGYQVAETVQVTVHDLTKVGALVQGLGTQQVQNISGPDFALENPDAGQEAARAKAIADAKAQAKVLAAQLGVSLGRIVSFSDNSGGFPTVYAMNASAGALAAPAPNLPTGTNTYSSTVSITYEIR